MLMSKLVGRTLRDVPKDAELPSHRLLLRSGMIRQYTAGLYGLLPLAQRCIAKIERIVREEMNAVEGQEVRMPCLATRELWSESGRYGAIGKDMFRLKDRHERDLVLNMTHEEPTVFLARTELTSYKQLPAMVYQLQTKFRDERRPRGGLIRLREFIMKDAYSFHEDEDCMRRFYDRVHAAYERIFNRVGARNVVSVLSDNGMFGGRFSHEFQLLVPTGEDKLITCGACAYRANSEIATSPYRPAKKSPPEPLAKLPTPGMKTIADLCAGLHVNAERTAKAVLFESPDGEAIIAFVRGDHEVVEAKLRNTLNREIKPIGKAALERSGACAGSTGPLGLKLESCRVIVDRALEHANELITGANEPDQHFAHFDMQRDFLATLTQDQRAHVDVSDIAAARPGDPCPACGGDLKESRGIEVGNIFHLGKTYTEAMNSTFIDKNGANIKHTMGCYGIGITRLLPALIEESHDSKGIIFPMPIAPYEVHLCALNRSEETVRSAADRAYAELREAGVEVLYDDRDGKAGSQFADSDLLGIPLRLTVSPRTLGQGQVELKYRDGREPQRNISLESLVEEVRSLVNTEYARYE